jgi:hypothetical protein
MDRCAAVAVRPLLEFLAEVPEHRRNNHSHPLAAVLALTTCAMLCGARSLYAAAQWGRDHGGELVRALGFRRKQTPCVATLHYVFKDLDVAAFEAALARWVAQAQPPAKTHQPRAVAIDGKSLRGSQGHQLPGVHLLAAFSARLGLPVLQVQTGRGPGGFVGSGGRVARQARPGGRRGDRRLCSLPSASSARASSKRGRLPAKRQG